MYDKGVYKVFGLCIFFVVFSIFCFYASGFCQYLPWSWPLGNPFPNLSQFPLSSWPQAGFFPTAGLSTTSGWPLYYPPPDYPQAPAGLPTSATGCPVGLVTGLTLEEEFGPGTRAITRCLVFRNNVKVVVQVNRYESSPGRPYALRNIERMINDYEITNGATDYKIAAILHSGGALFSLNVNAANPHPEAINNVYQPMVEGLIARGVKFYLCMNSARSDGIKAFHLIPGVQFVTTAPTALADFQKMGYEYVQP